MELFKKKEQTEGVDLQQKDLSEVFIGQSPLSNNMYGHLKYKKYDIAVTVSFNKSYTPAELLTKMYEHLNSLEP